MSYKENLSNNRKQTAQERASVDLNERLEKLFTIDGENAKRRWIWELLQNARDLAGENGVSININFENNKLYFSHNGKVFDSKELSRLIEQDSSKRDEEGPNRPLGRFGTGFLTTHLLSRHVTVEGIVHDEGEEPKALKLTLDRSGESPDELRKGLQKAFSALEDLDHADNIDYIPSEFNTTFCYELDSDGIEVMETGINDLYKCLPLTLALNSTLNSVSIEHEHISFEADQREKIDDNITRVKIRQVEGYDVTDLDYIIVNSEKLSIALPIDYTEQNFGLSTDSDKEQIRLQSIPNDFPRLYCGFPLIGSEIYPLPFITNNEEFYPTEKRDGIILTSGKHRKSLHNRAEVEKAVKLYWQLLKYAVDNEWENLFVFADIKKLPNVNWLDSQWMLDDILKPIRKRLLRKPIIETESNEQKPFIEAKSRVTSIPNEKNKEARLTLWQLNKDLSYISCKKEHIEEWQSKLWNNVQILYPEDLILRISVATNLENLSKSLNRDHENTIEWLKEVINFFIENNKEYMLHIFKGNRWYIKKVYNLINKKEVINAPIIPNQYGQFKLLNELKIDESDDESLKDILENLGWDVRSGLLHQDFSKLTSLDLKEDLVRFTKEDLATEIEKRIRKRLSDGDRHEKAFTNLLYWFDRNEQVAREFFPLYDEQHLLQTAEQAKEIRKKAAQADLLTQEVDRLKAEIENLKKQVNDSTQSAETPETDHADRIRAEQLMNVWAAVKKALGDLGDLEQQQALKDLETWLKNKPGLFEHVTDAAKNLYLIWITKVQRAKNAVKAELEKNSKYDCTNWLDDKRFPTIVQGVKYRGYEITLVVRPADGDFIILYDKLEKDVLSQHDTELWIEGGSFEAQRFTIGKLTSWLGVNRLPLKVYDQKPVFLNLVG